MDRFEEALARLDKIKLFLDQTVEGKATQETIQHHYDYIREALQRPQAIAQGEKVEALETLRVVIDQTGGDFYKEGHVALETVRNLLTQPDAGWLDISTAPKDGAAFIGRKQHFVFWSAWDDEDEVFFTQNRFYEDSHFASKYGPRLWQPTHWMPYQPPEKDKP